jgi:hypothetical protein
METALERLSLPFAAALSGLRMSDDWCTTLVAEIVSATSPDATRDGRVTTTEWSADERRAVQLYAVMLIAVMLIAVMLIYFGLSESILLNVLGLAAGAVGLGGTNQRVADNRRGLRPASRTLSSENRTTSSPFRQALKLGGGLLGTPARRSGRPRVMLYSHRLLDVAE